MLINIQFLRAMAALMVVMYHTVRIAIKNIDAYQELFMRLFMTGIVKVIVLYSVLHYKYIEKPLIKLAKKPGI